MKLLIVAGGGGHFAAALAVIQQLPKDVEILVVGREYAFEADKTKSFEYLTCKKLSIPFAAVTTGRLQRKLSSQTLISFTKIPVGYLQSLQIIKTFKPEVVLSFGGYVSLPVCVAARSIKIPVIVHEQTLGAGLSNRIVGKFAKKVCISWEQSKKFFPADKVVLTGNPIKRVILNETKNPDLNKILRLAPQDDRKIIYITGGSGGAHAINLLIEGALEKLLEKYILIHQIGDAQEFGDFDRLEKKKENLKENLKNRYLITKFVDPHEVFGVLEKSELVISRSGINTVTEVLSLGKPALFIPLPYGQRNEQLSNALFVKQLGLAEVVEQKDVTSDSLVTLIDMMIENIGDYKKNSEAAKKLIHQDAAEKIIALLTNGY